MTVSVRRAAKRTVVVLASIVGLFLTLQLIPYGRTHANPRTIEEPRWDSPRTRELAIRACFDCHSNHTAWPWYADVAPLSWVVQNDVVKARHVFNFSEWDVEYPLARYSGQSVTLGGMPPLKYRLAHPEARLTDEETLELARGLDATLKQPGER